MKKPRQTIARMIAARELARRYVEFHDGKDWRSIKLWGLAPWGYVSKLIKSGEILDDGYARENKTAWYRPSEDFYHWLVVPAIAEYRSDPRPEKSRLWFTGDYPSAKIPIN